MSTIHRMTISLPDDMAVVVKDAVEAGDYASMGDVVEEALHDWTSKRAVQRHELESLKADLDKGLADVATGRVTQFDAARIIARGRTLLATRLPSA